MIVDKWEGKQDMRGVHVSGGKIQGRKDVRADVTKGKSITRMMTGRKVAGKKVTTDKANRRSYSEVVTERALKTERVFLDDSIMR